MFLKLVARGGNRSKHYRMAFPNDPAVQRYMDAVKTGDTAARKKESQVVTQLAKNKLQTKHIQQALETYTNRMDQLANDALETVDEIMNDKQASKKVRADLAMEMIRHKVGSPTQKVMQQSEGSIVISFGDRHPDDVDPIEGETVE